MTVETTIYDEDSGLSSYANYIHKDSRGIIWAGTQFGLYRFDGQKFTVYNENNGLPFRQVMEIYEDSEGWFWLYKSCLRKPNCERDLGFFHPLTKEVKTFEQRFGNHLKIKTNQIQSIAQDSLIIYLTAGFNLLQWSADEGIRQVTIKGIPKPPYLFTKVGADILGVYYTENITYDSSDRKKENIFYAAIDLDGNLRQQPKYFSLDVFSSGAILNSLKDGAFRFDRIRIDNFELDIERDGTLRIDTLEFTMPSQVDTLRASNFDRRLLFNDELAAFVHPKYGVFKDLNVLFEEEVDSGFAIKKRIFTVWMNLQNESSESKKFYQYVVGDGFRHNFFDATTNIYWGAKPNGLTTYRFKRKLFTHVNDKENYIKLGLIAFELNENEVLLRIGLNLYTYNKKSKRYHNSSTSFQPKGSSIPAIFYNEEASNVTWSVGKFHLIKIDSNDLSMSKFSLPESINEVKGLLKMGKLLWLGGNGGIQGQFQKLGRSKKKDIALRVKNRWIYLH